MEGTWVQDNSAKGTNSVLKAVPSIFTAAAWIRASVTLPPLSGHVHETICILEMIACNLADLFSGYFCVQLHIFVCI